MIDDPGWGWILLLIAGTQFMYWLGWFMGRRSR